MFRQHNPVFIDSVIFTDIPNAILFSVRFRQILLQFVYRQQNRIIIDSVIFTAGLYRISFYSGYDLDKFYCSLCLPIEPYPLYTPSSLLPAYT